MRIDPANTAPVQTPFAYKRDDITVRHNRCLVHLLVVCQQLLASTLIPYKEFAVYEVVAADFVAAQEPVQLSRIRRSIGQETNPHGGVNQDDHAAECLTADAGSRRRRLSRARGSDPRRARSRSYAPWRTSASRPSRTVSVSVLAPQADLAFPNSRSSMCRVFFIHTIMPYKYGYINHQLPTSAAG